MPEHVPDVVIWGITTAGRKFRPSDWADRLAGLTAAFKRSDRLRYSALVQPTTVRGVRAVVVRGELRHEEPRLHQFLLAFARDNELVTTTCATPVTSPQSLTPPVAAPRTAEPREPV